MATLRTTSNDHRIQRTAMIDIDVPSMVGQNSSWAMFKDEVLNCFGDIQQGNRIHTVIWKIAERHRPHPENVARFFCSSTTGLKLCRPNRRITVARENAVSKEHDMDCGSVIYQLGDGASATENLIIWMRSHNQY
jgi:hypothetical protein